MAEYSVLIKNADVHKDRKFSRMDVAIKGDAIADTGDLTGANAKTIIDATGKIITPGFIDITNHSDTHWTLFNAPGQESMLLQGVTTIIGGNCGSSLAPLVKGEDIEGIQKWVNIRDININWRRVSELLSELSRRSLGVNFGALVGHGTLRRGIVGDESRPANREEISEMEILLRESMDEGAFGMSTALGAAHGRGTAKEELLRLFKVVSKEEGITKHHLKDEGRNIMPAIVELIDVFHESGGKMQFSHFKVLGRQSWNSFNDALALIESARSEGARLTIDFFPYTKTGSLLYQLLPPWILEDGKEKILFSLHDRAKRREVIDYLSSLTLHYDKIIVASAFEDKTVLGKTISDLASRAGISPEECLIKMIEINGLGVSIFNEVISSDHLSALASKDYSMFATDGEGRSWPKTGMDFDSPHPRSLGAMIKAIENYASGKSKLALGEVIYKLTEFPADVLGIKNRGKIEKGYYADLVILDPASLHAPSDYKDPYLRNEGVEAVYVNGELAAKSGEVTGKLAGRVIRKL